MFLRNSLIEDENGKWMFVPSYSPENVYEFPGISQACINATMDCRFGQRAAAESDSGL